MYVRLKAQRIFANNSPLITPSTPVVARMRIYQNFLATFVAVVVLNFIAASMYNLPKKRTHI